MKFRILIVMIASVGLAVSGLANAVPITHNDYTLNPTTNIVTHTDGTEWLQWDVTKGQSISDALGTYAGDGWVLAGNAQMAALFGNFGWSVGTDENTQTYIDGIYTSGVDDSTYDEFLELFGLTINVEGGYYGYGVNSLMNAEVYFGGDLDGDGNYNRAYVKSDIIFNWGGQSSEQADRMGMFPDDYPESDSRYDIGVALVRMASVPEPASLAIFALGTFGLALRRFKKQS
jgi:hypothetical protein